MIIHWQKTLISTTSTIKHAISIINSEALGVAIVVDESNILRGIITDGDVRRGLLKEVAINDNVSAIMNTSPFTASSSISDKQLFNLMESNGIMAVPIVDEERKVIGLKTLRDTLRQRKLKNPVFIMTGGFGTRLKPLTDDCPKPMLKVGDKPILEIIIRSFIRSGFENFYLSTHYMPDKIKEYFGNGESLGVNITYVHEETPLGTGGALGLLPSNIPDDLPLIMMNGDVLTKVDFQQLLDFHNDSQADATMCVTEYNYQVPFGVIENEGSKVVGMSEKPVYRFFVNAGMYVVSPQIVKSVPQNHKIDMPSLLEQHMGNNKNVMMFPIHEYWLDIGRIDDFNRAQTDIKVLDLDL